MNNDNNHLATIAFVRQLNEAEQSKYKPVPDFLGAAASQMLRERDEVRVPRSGSNPLTKWAAEQRRKKRQMQRESRRRNRR